MPYPLPTEHERRALFAWLKQASSLSAWRRLYTFNQAFVDVVCDVLRLLNC
jgi:Immunity protein 71